LTIHTDYKVHHLSSSPSSSPVATHVTHSGYANTFLPITGLMLAATSWGVIWYPYRAMEAQGLPAPIATFASYCVAILFGALFFRGVFREFAKHPKDLMMIGLAAGITNVAYLVAIMEAAVVRVVLLFYLAPLWTVPLARWLLKERITLGGVATIALAMTGAIIMLWRPELGAPMPKNGFEWLGMLGGFAFAVSNVLVRRAHKTTPEAKSLAGAIGVAVVALPVALFVVKTPLLEWSNAIGPHVLLLVIVGITLVASSVAMQYGLSKLTANRAAVILLFELIIAAIAAHYLAGEHTRVQEWIGGAMICAAGLVATYFESKRIATQPQVAAA
jgi:drug/metabolite transporter (DMT)-like permease